MPDLMHRVVDATCSNCRTGSSTTFRCLRDQLRQPVLHRLASTQVATNQKRQQAMHVSSYECSFVWRLSKVHCQQKRWRMNYALTSLPPESRRQNARRRQQSWLSPKATVCLRCFPHRMSDHVPVFDHAQGQQSFSQRRQSNITLLCLHRYVSCILRL